MQTVKKSFALGYSYILESFLSWWFYGVLVASGLSTIVLSFSNATGVPTAEIYSINTIGGYISVAGAFVCSVILKKKGIRFITTLSYLLTAAGILFVGHGSGLGSFLIFSGLTQFFYHGYCYGSSNALIANWFPRKRGFILGITTCGLMASTFTGVMFMTQMTPIWGWTTVCNIMAGVTAAVGIISWFWIKERPEDCGLLPDNMPITDAERAELNVPAKELWTVRQILAHKDGILYIVGFGCLNMVGTGTLTSTIPLMMEQGFSQVNSTLISSIAGVAAVLGSILLGVLDTKKGTKFASVVLGLFYCLGPLAVLLFGQMGSVAGVVLSNSITCAAGGGLANLGGSLVVNMYGRAGYNQAWRYLNTGAQLLKACCYAAIGLVTATLGQYIYVSGVWAVVGGIGLLCILAGKFSRRADPA